MIYIVTVIHYWKQFYIAFLIFIHSNTYMSMDRKYIPDLQKPHSEKWK
jgi:hypothetical protein